MKYAHGILRVVTFALALLAGASGRAGANCGAESCPLVPHGPEVPVGRFAFEVGWQTVDQDRMWDGTSAAADETPTVGHVTEELTSTRTWTFGARGWITPHFGLSASVPWQQREHRHSLLHHPGFSQVSEWSFEGLGDASVVAHWVAFGERGAGLGTITLQAGAKLPTGRRDAPMSGTEELEVSGRIGSGSTDALVGLQILREVTVPTFGGRAHAPIGLSLTGRMNGRGTDDYRMGDEFHVALTGAYPLGSVVDFIAQWNVVSHGHDVAGTAEAGAGHGAAVSPASAAATLADDETAHTGGSAMYFTPGLSAKLPGGLSAFAYWQVRAYQRTNGEQLVGPTRVVVGSSFRLGR